MCRNNPGAGIMPEVVDADVLQAGAGADPLPEGLQVAEAGALLLADDYPGVILNAADLFQHLDRRLAAVHHLGAGLGVPAVAALCREIHVLSFQRHDLTEPAAGQDQQASGGDSRGHFDTFPLHLAQHLADALQFGRAQELLALFLGILLDVLARTLPSGRRPHILGEVEYLGDRRSVAPQRYVRSRTRVSARAPRSPGPVAPIRPIFPSRTDSRHDTEASKRR